jgi:hypothetical protein
VRLELGVIPINTSVGDNYKSRRMRVMYRRFCISPGESRWN